LVGASQGGVAALRAQLGEAHVAEAAGQEATVADHGDVQGHALVIELLQRLEEDSESFVDQPGVKGADKHDAAFGRQAQRLAGGAHVGRAERREVERDRENAEFASGQGEALLRLAGGPPARGEHGDVEFLPEAGSAGRLDGRDILRIGRGQQRTRAAASLIFLAAEVGVAAARGVRHVDLP